MLLSGAIHPFASSELAALAFMAIRRTIRGGSPRGQRRKSDG
jgi:hypothetical protein